MLVLNVRSIIGYRMNCQCVLWVLCGTYEPFIFEKWLCVHLARAQGIAEPDDTENIWSKNRGGTLVLWPLQYIICVVFVYFKYTRISIHTLY